MNDDAQSGDDVLSGLPRTRPTHTSAKRAAARAKAAKGTTRAAAAPSRPRVDPEPAAEADVAAPAAAADPEPEAVAAAAADAPKREEGDRAPTGAELVATAVQAAGEVLDLGGKALKGILGRLPRL